jgi:Fe-S cluster biogenesis protein NfuA
MLILEALFMLEDKIKKAIEEIRPQIQSHGGDVNFVGVEDGVVKVSLTGACAGCPMSQMTLQNGIQTHLKQKIPEIKKVEAV